MHVQLCTANLIFPNFVCSSSLLAPSLPACPASIFFGAHFLVCRHCIRETASTILSIHIQFAMRARYLFTRWFSILHFPSNKWINSIWISVSLIIIIIIICCDWLYNYIYRYMCLEFGRMDDFNISNNKCEKKLAENSFKHWVSEWAAHS